jgi:hypothetical protein
MVGKGTDRGDGRATTDDLPSHVIGLIWRSFGLALIH